MNRTLNGDVQYNDGELGISQCVWCRHRSADGHRCRAFPKGIPEAIIKNRHDHRYPYDGDYGVRFEPEEVEIEFIGVESEPEAIPLSAELAVAMARVGGDDSPAEQNPAKDECSNVLALGVSGDLELEEDVFDVSATASA